MAGRDTPELRTAQGLREIALAIFYSGERREGSTADIAWDRTTHFAEWLEAAHPNSNPPVQP